jgi:hypothetical protein
VLVAAAAAFFFTCLVTLSTGSRGQGQYVPDNFGIALALGVNVNKSPALRPVVG